MNSSPLELHALTRLCGDVIGIPAPAPGDNFIEVGGDSLMALRVVTLLEERWNISVEASDILFAENFAELHAEVTGLPISAH
ncbi:acyl carrier protein [Streptomyces sp. NPDC001273]|uniref:acyl carrier protein n=1 Tax=unclassified Streptomyces TaxID=2593676 RepID=UPI0033C52E58